jgi:anaerobic selenocysteine-containing dehydrogenase
MARIIERPAARIQADRPARRRGMRLCSDQIHSLAGARRGAQNDTLAGTMSAGVRTTTCYMCACRCGMRVHLRDGALRYIDASQPKRRPQPLESPSGRSPCRRCPRRFR